MPHQTEHIRLKLVGDDHVLLERTDSEGADSSIDLTVKDVLYLAQNMSQFARRALAFEHAEALQKDPDLKVSLVAHVEGVGVNIDTDNSRITLSIRDDFNAESHFALTPALARAIGPELVRRAEELEKTDEHKTSK